MTKEIRINATWHSTHWLEVPDDFEVSSNLNDWPDDVLEQITSDTAELVDWVGGFHGHDTC